MNTLYIDYEVEGCNLVLSNLRSGTAAQFPIGRCSAWQAVERSLAFAKENNCLVIVVKAQGLGGAILEEIRRQAPKAVLVDGHNPAGKSPWPKPRKVALIEDPWVVFEKTFQVEEDWVEVARFPTLAQAQRINEFVGDRFHAVRASGIEAWKRGE